MLPTSLDALFALFVVFVRCSAAIMSSPLFGAQNTPVQIRVFTNAALSFALSVAVKANVGPVPADLGGLFMTFANEVAAGLIIGLLMQLVIQIMTIAGSFLDMQVGLGMSQTMNPIFGIPISVLGQFKTMLGMVIFLAFNGHHYVIQAVVSSYKFAPTLTASDLGLLNSSLPTLLSNAMLVAIQIAAPVLGVSLIVDAALGLMSKALPQLQPIQLGMPAKLGLGIAAVSLSLPAIAAGTQNGIARSFELIGQVFAR
jgi:flagellar biosynthesis protein FliR